jgi:ankyrin repeat protein
MRLKEKFLLLFNRRLLLAISVAFSAFLFFSQRAPTIIGAEKKLVVKHEWPNRPVELDPDKEPDYRMDFKFYTGMFVEMMTADIRNGKLYKIFRGSPGYIGHSTVYYFENDRIVGVVSKGSPAVENYGMGKRMISVRPQDLDINRVLLRKGKIVSWVKRDGQPLPFAYQTFKAQERSLKELEKYYTNLVKYRESWTLEKFHQDAVYHPVLQALHCGNASEAHRLFAQINVASASPELFNQIAMLSVESNNSEMLQLALQSKFEPKSKTAIRTLCLASWLGYFDMVKALVDSGVPADVKDYDEHYPVEYAICSGNLPLFKFLFDKVSLEKRDPYFLREFSYSLMLKASTFARLEIADALLEYGCHTLLKDFQVARVLCAAASGESEEFFKFLLESKFKAKLDEQSLQAALRSAVMAENVKSVEILLGLGVNPDSPDDDKKTTLMLLLYRSNCSAKSKEIIRMLIAAGANLQSSDRWGKTVWQYAAHQKDQEVLGMILPPSEEDTDDSLAIAFEKAAENYNFPAMEHILLNHPDFKLENQGKKAFASSLKFNRIQVIDWFFRRGFDLQKASIKAPMTIYLKNIDKYSSWNEENILSLLLENGAQVNETDEIFASALDYLWLSNCEWKNDGIAFLENAGGKDSFVAAILQGDIDKVQSFTNLKERLKIKDKRGNNLLHLCAREGQAKLISYLVEAGIPVDEKNDDLKTPLWLAIEFDQLEAARVLHDKGAQIDARNENGETILYEEVKTASPQAVEFLLKNGASLFPKTKHRWSGPVIGRLLCNPGFEKRTEVAEILLKYGAQVDSPDHTDSMLHNAASMDWKEDVVWLLNHGARINALNEKGRTPLDSALRLKRFEMADFLRSLGAKTAEELNK